MFEENEKQLIKEALSLYVQYVGQQIAPDQLQQIVEVVKEVITKLDTEQTENGEEVKPAGIRMNGLKMSVKAVINYQTEIAKILLLLNFLENVILFSNMR